MFSNSRTVANANQSSVEVFSLDFDGCLFNIKYILSRHNQSPSSNGYIVDANELLIAHIQQRLSTKPIQGIFMVGSSRQCHRFDALNCGINGTESCFLALKTLCQHLDKASETSCVIDGYLMADSFNGLPPGSSYVKALEQIEKRNPYDRLEDHPMAHGDETKASLLYAQIHKVASDYPDTKIIFNFYDDRVNILDPLENFFTNNSYLPKNVELRLYHYNGKGDVRWLFTLYPEPSAIIDYHFALTIRKMMDFCSGPVICENWKDVDVAKQMSLQEHEELRNFRAKIHCSEQNRLTLSRSKTI